MPEESFLLTEELLTNYGFSKKIIDKFKEKYPTGAKVAKILYDGYFTIEEISQFFYYFPFTKTETATYKTKKLHISNSMRCEDSQDVSNSDYVISSSEIHNSKLVFNSKQVNNSENIIGSQEVLNCKIVNNSKIVSQSQYIVNANRVMDSHDIIGGADIESSAFCIDGNHISSSFGLYHCTNTDQCILSGFTDHSHHCICCMGVKNAEYMIFNTPVDPATFEQYQIEFQAIISRIKEFHLMSFEQGCTLDLPTPQIIYSHRYSDIFTKLPKTLKRWILRLPNCTPERFQLLFFQPIPEL